MKKLAILAALALSATGCVGVRKAATEINPILCASHAPTFPEYAAVGLVVAVTIPFALEPRRRSTPSPTWRDE